jgi:NTP pyrophosphatase (non-canonical NTP hydrolase)
MTKAKRERFDKTCYDALTLFGDVVQQHKAIEELGELIVALAKDNDTAAIIDEIADVHIMLCQLAIMYGPDKVGKRVDFKIKRLAKLIKEASK